MYLVIPFNFIPNHPQTLTQGGRASAYLSPDCKIPPVSENLFTPLQLPLQISSSGCPPLVNASTSVCLLSSSRNHYNTHQPSTPSSSSPTPPIRFFPLHKYQIPIRSNLAHIIMGRTVTVFQLFIAHSYQATQHRTASARCRPRHPDPTNSHSDSAHLGGEAEFKSFATLLFFG